LDPDAERDTVLQLFAIEPVLDMQVRDILDTEGRFRQLSTQPRPLTSIWGVELSNAFSVTARARYTFEVDNQPQKSTWVRLLKRAVAKAEDAEVSKCLRLRCWLGREPGSRGWNAGSGGRRRG